MPALTLSQIAYLRLMLAAFSASFTDAELTALAGVAYSQNRLTFLQGTLAYAFYQLAAQAVMMVNFRQGETSESQSVIFDRLTALSRRWETEAGYSGGLPTSVINALRQYAVLLPEDVLPNAL